MENLKQKVNYEEYPCMFFDPASKRVIVGYAYKGNDYLAYDPIARIWFNRANMQEIKFDDNFDIVDPAKNDTEGQA